MVIGVQSFEIALIVSLCFAIITKLSDGQYCLLEIGA
jgi:hypothetical protein